MKLCVERKGETAGYTLSVFVRVLEGLDQPQGFVHRSSHWEIVHGDLPQVAFPVDDEQTPDDRCVTVRLTTSFFLLKSTNPGRSGYLETSSYLLHQAQLSQLPCFINP